MAEWRDEGERGELAGAFVSNERASEPFIFIVAGVKLFQRGHLRGLFISHRTAGIAFADEPGRFKSGAARRGARYRGE